MRRIFEDNQGNKIEQLDLPDYGYDARKRTWYRDTMQSDRGLVSSPYASFSVGTPMITLSAPLRGHVRGVLATELLLSAFIPSVAAFIVFGIFGALDQHRHAPIMRHALAELEIDWGHVIVVGVVLIAILGTNIATNLRLGSHAADCNL